MRIHTKAQAAGATLMLAALTAPLPVPAAGQFQFQDSRPARSLRPGEVSAPMQVAAKTNRWQNSGVWLEAGGHYLVTAQGQWRLGPTCTPTGPDGVGLYNLLCWDIGGKTVGSVSHGTLVGRIGHDGPPFAVGANLEFTPQASGALYLMVNDHPDFFADNSGAVSAKIRMLGAAPGSAAAPSRETTEIIIRQETPQSSNTVKIRRGGGGGGSTGAVNQ